MIKYVSAEIVLAEVPDEITLAFSISNCPGRCEGCHSPWLREDIGDDLERDLPGYLEKYQDRITCVAFLGEGNDSDALCECLQAVHKAGLKTCVYSGKKDMPQYLRNGVSDYVKYGAYERELGGLEQRNTNQKMMKYNQQDGMFEDITCRFWKESV